MIPQDENNKIIIKALRSLGLMPVFTGENAGYWDRILEILYRNNVRVIEFTHPRETIGLKIFSYILKTSSAYADVKIGIGTVLNARSANKYLDAGAAFIASPFLHEDLATICSYYKALWIPGCSSRKEIELARGLGANVISLQPGSFTDRQSLAELVRDFSDLHFIPSSAMCASHRNLIQWIQSGALCIREGLPIFPRDVSGQIDWLAFEQRFYAESAAIRHKINVIPRSPKEPIAIV